MALQFKGGKAVDTSDPKFGRYKADFSAIQTSIAKVVSELQTLHEIRQRIPVDSRTQRGLARLGIEQLRSSLADVASTAGREKDQ